MSFLRKMDEPSKPWGFVVYHDGGLGRCKPRGTNRVDLQSGYGKRRSPKKL